MWVPTCNKFMKDKIDSIRLNNRLTSLHPITPAVSKLIALKTVRAGTLYEAGLLRIYFLSLLFECVQLVVCYQPFLLCHIFDSVVTIHFTISFHSLR